MKKVKNTPVVAATEAGITQNNEEYTQLEDGVMYQMNLPLTACGKQVKPTLRKHSIIAHTPNESDLSHHWIGVSPSHFDLFGGAA